jgi:hypothetical protein
MIQSNSSSLGLLNLSCEIQKKLIIFPRNDLRRNVKFPLDRDLLRVRSELHRIFAEMIVRAEIGW